MDWVWLQQLVVEVSRHPIPSVTSLQLDVSWHTSFLVSKLGLVVKVYRADRFSAAFAVQSYIFAQLIAVFQLTGPELTDRGNFWSLMFFIEGMLLSVQIPVITLNLTYRQAICVGIFYFVLGWTASSISIVSTHTSTIMVLSDTLLQYVSTTYRQQYFESILGKPIAFYDVEENSAGSLTSRLSTDPTQLQELLGANMAFPLIAVFNVLGCIAISFAFGWKLTLVTVFSALPVIVSAGFMRVRFEIQFEKLNAAVFAESSQFASEVSLIAGHPSPHPD